MVRNDRFGILFARNIINIPKRLKKHKGGLQSFLKPRRKK
jgi:hypothetical protein